MRGAIDEAARVGPRGRDHQMAGHREISPDAFAHGDIGGPRLRHVRKPPHRHAPVRRGRGEEFPVAELLANGRVGHVVGGERKARQPQQGLAVANGGFGRREMGFAQGGLVDEKVRGGGHGASPWGFFLEADRAAAR